MLQNCKGEATSTTVLGLLLLLPFILGKIKFFLAKSVWSLFLTHTVTECCPGGYKFVGLSPDTIDLCDPFINGVHLLCEVNATAATARHILDIQWHFNSSSGTLVKLANETSNHLIFNSYHNRVFKSVLSLRNLSDGTDNGKYICQGIVEPNNILLPQPSFIIPQASDIFFNQHCGSKPQRKVDRFECATASSLKPPVSVQATSTTLSMSLQTTRTKSTDSLSMITSTFIETVISASSTFGNTVLPPIATDSVNNIASTTTSKILTESTSPASNTAVNIVSSTSTASSNSLTGNTIIHSSIIASSTLSSNGNTAVHSHSSSPSTVSTDNTGQYPVGVWMYIIVTILSTSLLIFVTLVLVAMICFICRRSSSSPTIGNLTFNYDNCNIIICL